MLTKEKEVMIGTATLGNESSAPQQAVISDDQYAEMERKQSERRFFMTGRKRNDDSSNLITRNDIRTCMVLDKDQYDKIREIALRETMTIKDLTNMMFQLAIDQYEKKHGVVVPRTESAARKTIF